MSQRNLITNFNASPFYDDFDEAKKFLRILFRPTYPIQARELTQLQTILNNQVSSFGSSIYKDGSTVTGGSLTLTDVVSIKLPTGTVFNGGTNNLTSLLTQNNAGTGYQVNDVLKLSYGVSDSILATIGINNVFTYTLVNNITPAGFFGKVLTESYNVTSGAQNAQFQVNSKVTTSVAPTYKLVHSGGTAYTADVTLTQTHSDATIATGVVVSSTHVSGTVTTTLLQDTVIGTFDTLTAVVQTSPSVSATPSSVTIDLREESPVFRVQGFTTATTTDLNPTIFGSYETEDEFISGDEIRLLASDDITVSTTSLGILPSGTIQYDSQISSVSEGVFYTNGFFVQIDQQSIPLNKYDRNITARIGYDVSESIVSETDDPTLLDNASGATNENAPGAYRFKMSLTLTYKIELATNDDVDNTSDIGFYQIGKIESGKIIDIKTKAVGNAIVDEIAKRVFDINGNFVIDPFIFTVKDKSQFTVNPTTHGAGSAIVRVTSSITSLTAADFAGKTLDVGDIPLKILSAVQNPVGSTPASSYADIFDLTLQNVSSGTIGGVVPPWLTTVAETAVSVSDPDNFQATLAPGLAYIDGYRYETIAPKKLDLEKTTTTKHISDPFTFSTNVSSGNFLPLTRKSGSLKSDDFRFGTRVLLYATKQGALPVHDGEVDKAIGTARIKQLVRNDASGGTWGVDVSSDGQVQGTLEAYLFDLRFNDGTTNATDTTTGATTTALARVTATVNVAAAVDQKRINFDASSVSADTGAHLLGASFVSDGVRYRVTEVAVTLTHQDTSGHFNVGQIITGATSGAKGEVITETDVTHSILFNVTGTFLESEFISNSSGTIVSKQITAAPSYSGAIIKTNINIQTEIADDAVLNFDYDARNIKSIKFGVDSGTGAAHGAIYDVNASAEFTDANGYAATQLQETDKKKLIFPIADSYLESIKNTTVMYMKTVDLTTSVTGVATPSLSTTNGTESIVQDMSKVIGVATQTVAGAVNYTIGDHLRVGSISSSTITFVQHSGTAISGASLTVRLSFPVIRTSIPSGSFDGDLSIPTDYIFGNIVDTDLFNGSNFVDSAAGQVRLLKGTFADGAITSSGAKNWKRIGLTGVTKLIKIYEEVGTVSSTDQSLTDATKFTDITGSFDIDFAQYEEYVGQAKIALKAGSDIPDPAQDLLVVVDRVKTTTDSGGANIFYSANSYSTLYSHLTPPVDFGKVLDYRFCVDFRPRVEETATATNPATVGDEAITFTDKATIPFASNVNTMTGQITSYYGRLDKLLITNDLDMEIIQGIPNPNPEAPEADGRSLVLYNIGMPAYTLKKTGVSVNSVENAHYTMSDLANIDQRVQSIEKDTQLDNVENAILAAEVSDSSNTNLFKTGVLVDSFRNFDVAFTQSADFIASLDQKKGQLRPSFDTYCLSIDYDENDTLSTASESPDGILLAPLDTHGLNVQTAGFIDGAETVIKQVTASKVENINPFNVTVFEGTPKLFPSSDFWKDETISDVIIQDPSNKEAWDQILPGKPEFEFGSWEDNWTGSVTRPNLFQAIGNIFRPPGHKHQDKFKTGNKRRTITKVTYTTEIKRKMLGQTIVDSKVIPFMRNPPNGKYSKLTNDVWGSTKDIKTRAGIHFNAEGMKPRTDVYSFFDDTAIISYIRPAIIIKVANNPTNLAVYGTSSGAWEGGARDLAASFSGGSRRSSVSLSTSSITGNDAKCILVLKSADVNHIYWHVVPPSRSSALYDVTNIQDFTGGGTAGTIAVDTTSMVITGVIRAKKYGSFRMKTDSAGGVGGIFEVPLTTFSTGSRTLLITDSTSGDVTSAKTYAQMDFRSGGMKLKIQNRIMETRVPVKHVDVSYQSGKAIQQRAGVSTSH